MASEAMTTPDRPQTQMPAATPAGERLQSLDVLRGFDMFWITGGAALIASLAKATGWGWLQAVTPQLEHVPWAGFHFFDLIFPLFVFISGVTLPLALGRRRARGESRSAILFRLARRALVLVLFGILVNNDRVMFDLPAMRLGSVLGRIGLAGLGAGVIVLFFRPRAQVAWLLAILLGYWALLTFVPVPGLGIVGGTDQDKNLVDYLDKLLLPGKLYLGNHDPEGLLSTLPAVASALLGALAGAWLCGTHTPWRKGLGLLLAGLVLLGAGWLWGREFPVIKNLWTSTFVLVAGGWSCLLLAVFYWIVDGLRWRRWGFLFMLIGMNPLTLYVLRGVGLIDFSNIGQIFFGFAVAHAAPAWKPFCSVVATLTVQFAFLYWLWRNKIFWRV